jgi:hypothetical protein
MGRRVCVFTRLPPRHSGRALDFMSAQVPSRSVALWHRRILGGLWAFCAICLLAFTFRKRGWIDDWYDRGPWILALVCAVYFAVAVGFLLGRPWARTAMVLLMTLTAIISMFLAAGGVYFDDLGLFWGAAVTLVVAAYTVAADLLLDTAHRRI